ncbi:MAG: TIGR02266 family protein [Myxococcales bacterium]|nr:TIGR02266 family protein [Myxococcota bacterium]MDW8283738.1 TIGR02266 family protein [Myxococcales bacterium]
MPAPDDRRATRTPITLKIKFKSSSLDQFIERYSVDVSRGGIFIRTKEPLPVGTTLRFEFQLQDGSSLIGGEGTVVWNRAYDPNRIGVAPGMGVRFDKLTADSQRVLERILSEKHRRGEAQLESRFDAGVRASREQRVQEFSSEVRTPLPAPVPGMGMISSPGAAPASGGFGDEPTRMMGADQISRLAAEMQRAEDFTQEQPTRRATLDEIRRAVSAAELSQPPGRTSQQADLGLDGSAGNSSKSTSAMGVVDPRLAAGTVPTSASAELVLPPSLSTRQVSDEEAAALIAASVRTPPSQVPPASEPPTPAPSSRVGSASAQAATPTPPIDAPAPVLRGSNGLGAQTLSCPPPAEVPHVASQPPAPTPEAASPPTQVPPSGISIGLDFDGAAETSASATPLNPADFAPAGHTAKPEPKPAPAPPAEATPAPPPVHPPHRPRTAVQLVVLVALVGVAGAGIYALVLRHSRPGSVTPPPLERRTDPPPPQSEKTSIGEPPAVPPPAESPPPASEHSSARSDNSPASRTTQPEAPPVEDRKPQLLKPAVVAISSDPPGARVEVAGRTAGETPIEISDLPPGHTHDVKLSLRGFQDARIKVRPVPGERKVLTVKMVPYERVVEVHSTPRNAEVFVDGKKAGRTPIVLRKLDMSRIHEIEVRKSGYVPQTAKVADTDTFDVRNGREVRTLNMTLEAISPPRPERSEAAPSREGKRGSPPPRGTAQGEPPPKAEGKPEPSRAEEAPRGEAPPKVEVPGKSEAAPRGEAPKGEPARADAPRGKPEAKEAAPRGEDKPPSRPERPEGKAEAE